MGGKRYNEGKPPLHHILYSRKVIEGEANVWGKGVEKYDEGNWLKGQTVTTAIDSLLRHCAAYINGEDLDPETSLPHVDHIQCSAKILSNSYHYYPELDDRPAKKLSK